MVLYGASYLSMFKKIFVKNSELDATIGSTRHTSARPAASLLRL